jgi:hypothetical protein
MGFADITADVVDDRWSIKTPKVGRMVRGGATHLLEIRKPPP